MDLESEGWQRLGPLDRFPADRITAAQMVGQYGNAIEVAVVRTAAGIDVVLDRCPHQGVPFTERGCLNNHRQLVCTWHDWTFNLPNGTDTERPGGGLQTFESRIENDVLWAVVDPDDFF